MEASAFGCSVVRLRPPACTCTLSISPTCSVSLSECGGASLKNELGPISTYTYTELHRYIRLTTCLCGICQYIHQFNNHKKKNKAQILQQQGSTKACRFALCSRASSTQPSRQRQGHVARWPTGRPRSGLQAQPLGRRTPAASAFGAPV